MRGRNKKGFKVTSKKVFPKKRFRVALNTGFSSQNVFGWWGERAVPGAKKEVFRGEKQDIKKSGKGGDVKWKQAIGCFTAACSPQTRRQHWD